MPKAISCGFIIFDRHTGEILGCHPTGRPGGPEMSFDIPKGHLEEGEEPLVTALRELYEETGLVLPQDYPVHQIGLRPYQKQKSLFLFSTEVDNLKAMLPNLKCNSMFTDSFGNQKPEVDRYTAVSDPNWFFHNMQPHIKAEIERAKCEPVCRVEATVDDTTTYVKLQLTDELRNKCRDSIVYLKDSNVYPNGISFDVKLSTGDYANIDIDDLQKALVSPVVVDVTGLTGALPTFDINEWLDQALAHESLH